MDSIQQFAWEHPWVDDSVNRQPPTRNFPAGNGGAFKGGLSINL